MFGKKDLITFTKGDVKEKYEIIKVNTNNTN